MRFDVILPGLSGVDLVLGDPQRPVDRLRLRGLEDAAAVAHQALRGTVSLDGRPEHDQVGGQVLARGQHTGQQGAAEVLQNRDHVDGLAGLQPMILDIADVDRPGVMTVGGRKRHRLRVVRCRCGGVGRHAHRPVQGEDAAAGPRAEVDALLRQRRMHPELAQLGIGLSRRDRHRFQIDLAGRLTRPGWPVLEPGQPSCCHRSSVS